ncbi:hypothetical protein AYI69_g1714, partial [Smittium culicis]
MSKTHQLKYTKVRKVVEGDITYTFQ